MSSVSIMKTKANVNVASAGTAVAIAATSVVAQSCIIQALDTNTGAVYVGDSSVLASDKRGIKLVAGAALPLTADAMGGGVGVLDLSTIYVDAVNNNDKVSIIYLARP